MDSMGALEVMEYKEKSLGDLISILYIYGL